MNGIDEVLNSIHDEGLESVKKEFKELLNQAKSQQKDFVRQTAKKIELWLHLRMEGTINDDELEALLNARRRTLRQHLNTVEINARAQLEKTTIGLIDIALKCFLKKII